MKNKVNDLKIIYNKTIKVVGVTFAPHPKNINKIIKNGLYYKELQRYQGLKDKELIKNDLTMKEFSNEALSDVILKPYKFEHKDAIKVLINDFDDNYLEVGNIPADEVESLMPFLNEKDNMIISAYLTGGNLKNIIHNEEKNYIEIEELNIGIALDIIVKERN